MTSTRRVVRRFGSDVTHVVGVPLTLLATGESFGKPLVGVVMPVAAACGSVLRDSSGIVVAMQPGTPIRCRQCSRMTGLEVAAAGNTATPEGTR